jgi:hypothetical protein
MREFPFYAVTLYPIFLIASLRSGSSEKTRLHVAIVKRLADLEKENELVLMKVNALFEAGEQPR